MSSTIHDKTIRPGSLRGYSYYYSNRRPVSAAAVKPPKAKRARLRSRKGRLTLALLIVLGGFWLGFRGDGQSQTPVNNQAPAVAATTMPANWCAGNVLPKLVKIGINERHFWACEAGHKVYDAPVITGLRNHPETETPLGTYKIYAKQTNTTLTGTDSRGTWRDPVYYWMPFLDNQYGTYGFHDATWRANSAFGQISPDSQQASHGCVELPLNASRWLYDWAPVGTTVSVES